MTRAITKLEDPQLHQSSDLPYVKCRGGARNATLSTRRVHESAQPQGLGCCRAILVVPSQPRSKAWGRTATVMHQGEINDCDITKGDVTMEYCCLRKTLIAAIFGLDV